MKQIELLDFPELDKQKTKEEVEDTMNKYRMYRYLSFEDREVSTTSAWKDIVVKTSGGNSDQTGDAAIYNADTKAYQKRYCDRVERAVRRLPQLEQFLIEKRYMDREADYMTDLKMYTQTFQPPIGHKFYYKLKWKAFYKLALALDLNVTKSDQ
ncbi:transcriptional regulator [Alkalihalobacillus sp. LMS6]|uniref:ArpU family phage packaging/lysis transcriptional regulator n=1 Tax=Alkalihalobacillus sp. LMS6 TaxID=2924034 RepID=UPI0020D0D37E|nr:ArpU family phage packaging/lysis transcriptional regulator [Alkalihalobacillus sp. LMS6]UTR05403.1 transcriptional regulator [Alkalihalobacillus sp. LMS6]